MTLAGARPARRLAQPEFVAMLALLFATVAFSIDAMLPALPAIAGALSPADPNRAQLVLTSFVFGMGIGTLFVGPLSDAFGRRPAIFGGFLLYAIGALLAWRAPSLELLLAARVLQGIGAAGPRIAGIALTRDLYQGREMARVTSFVMMVFMVVPAVAPSIGQVIILSFGWRSVFLAFVLFGLAGTGWVALRQDETLAPALRRPLSLSNIALAARDVLSDAEVRRYTTVMTLGMGQLFALLSSIQPIFGETYGRAASFPLWFAGIAAISATASVVNARTVMRLGMRHLCIVAFGAQTIVSLTMAAVLQSGFLQGDAAFAAFFLWAASLFFVTGLTIGNLNALSLQRMGHIAGMAASIIGCVSTVASVLIAIPIGLLYDGTGLPVVIGAAISSAMAWWLMRGAPALPQPGHG